MTQGPPRLSVGLAVRNGEPHVRRCIESVLAQDFTDFELTVCDNVSDDGTVALVHEYARSDQRIALHVNDVNIGLHENMKRVFELARGTYFRWISADDWLEPGCLSTCVSVLDRQPEAVGVTTGFTIHTADGGERYEEYAGEFPTSPDPVRRFERMLWFFHAGDALYDPIYGVHRRAALLRAHPLRPNQRTDWLLSAELALMGPILHVHERLAHRSRDYPVGIDHAAFRRRLDPVRGEQLKTTARRLYRELYALAVTADLTPEQLRRCRRALARFAIREMRNTVRERAVDTRARMLSRAS